MGRAEGSCLLSRLSFLTFCLLLPFSLPSEAARIQSHGRRLVDGNSGRPTLMVYSRGIAVLQHLGMRQENLRPLRYIQMWSGVAEGVGGGGYDCFPALAAAGIERAAGEGGKEGGRKREGPGGGVGPGKGRERRGWFSSAARWMDGWNRGRGGGGGGRGVYTTSAPTGPGGEVNLC